MGPPTLLSFHPSKLLPIDALAMIVTSRLLQDVQRAYQDANFHEMWTLLTNFCEDDLRFYLRAIESRPAKTGPVAQATLVHIATVLLQRLAPLTPFLAEHFYHLIPTEGMTNNQSIFQNHWHLLSPIIEKTLQVSDIETNDAKAEWEALKDAHDAES